MNNAGNYWDKRLESIGPWRGVMNAKLTTIENKLLDKSEQDLIFSKTGSIVNKKVLDVGCGFGRFGIRLLKRGAELTAIDISEKMLKAFSKNCPKRYKNKLKLVLGESTTFETNEKYDIIFCLNLFFHLNKNQRQKTILHCLKHLKKGGQMYVAANIANTYREIESLKKRNSIKKNGYHFEKLSLEEIHSYKKYFKKYSEHGFCYTSIASLLIHASHDYSEKLSNTRKMVEYCRHLDNILDFPLTGISSKILAIYKN